MGRNSHYCFAWIVTVLGTMMLWGQAAGAQSTTEVRWVDGADRYEVAVAAVGGSCSALAGSDGSVKLALATGENWPDALAASALDRPLLLTPTASLHPAVRRLVDGCAGAVDIVILGGTSAVSQTVQDELTALGASVQRIKGDHRYETARKIAEFAAPGKVGLVYLATGANFADAISAAPRVTVSSPIVLTPKAALGPDASAFLSSQLTTNARVVILGGTAAVSEAAEDDVRALGLNPRRIFGPDRYATSARTASESLQDPNCTAVEDIAVASGTDPYGGLVAASTRGPCEPMLLAPPPGRSVSADLTNFLETWSATLNASSTAPCRISMVGARATLGAQLLTDSASALQTAGCTPPTDNADTQPPDTTDTQSPDDAEQFRNDSLQVVDYSQTVCIEGTLNREISCDAVDWWERPRGELTVNVHLCIGKGLEHHFARSNLEAMTQSYNSYIAPFYSWQSSGLLRVTFKPGDIVVSEELKPGTRLGRHGIFAPRDCLARYDWQPNAAHAFMVYGDQLELGSGGLGYLSGPFSVTYVIHDAEATEPWRDWLADIDWRKRVPFVVQHEFDHNVGARHHNDKPFGYIRWWTHPSDDGHVGSLQGYPNIGRLRRDDNAGLARYSVWPCYELSAQGWPMGEGHPACARIPPDSKNVRIERQSDGTVLVRWAVSAINPEPVTGYEVELLELRTVGDGGFTTHGHPAVAIYSVDADAKSFTLPTHKTDGTAYVAIVKTISAVGTDANFTDSFTFLPDVEVEVTHVQSGTGSYGVNLTWPAAPGATSYKITGFEDCMRDVSDDDGATSSCFRGFNRTEYTLQSYDVVTGKSYDIEIFACNEGGNLAPTDAPRDCYLYAFATVDLRTSTVRLVHEGTSNAGFILRADWTPTSQSVEYEVWASLCQNDQAPCVPTEISPGFGYSSDSGTSSGRLLLDHGKRYWISVRACQPRTPEDPGFYRPNKCPVFADAWYTVPAHSS